MAVRELESLVNLNGVDRIIFPGSETPKFGIMHQVANILKVKLVND